MVLNLKKTTEILKHFYVTGGDNQLASFAKNAKQNATYHSAKIQNDLISTAAFLNLSRCVEQGYDGASVLASDRVGASLKFRSESNHAYYFHCAMHCLNLSAMKAVSVPAIRNAHDTIKQVVTCFKSSSKRTSLLKSIIRNEHDARISKNHLISLCTTKFVERYTAVKAFRSLLLYINNALQQMTQWHSYESRNTAQGLLNATSQPSFIISMVN